MTIEVQGIQVEQSPYMIPGSWMALDAADNVIFFGSIGNDQNAPAQTRRIVVAPDLYQEFKALAPRDEP